MRVRVIATIALFGIVSGAFAHGGGHADMGAGSGSSHSNSSGGASPGDWNPFARKPNETPEEVEAKQAELESDRTAAVERKAAPAEVARLDRKKAELDARHIIAKLRVDRNAARQSGDTEEVARLEERLDQAKAKLAKLRQPASRR